MFSLIKGSKSEDFAEGSAREAWKQILNKFEPKKAPNRLQKKKKIQSLKLKYGQDPDIYISVLEDLITKYKDAVGRWDEDKHWNTSVGTSQGVMMQLFFLAKT